MTQSSKRVSQLPEAPVANFGNGWRSFRKGNRYWAECSRGKRPRQRFRTRTEADDHAAVQSRLQGNRNEPLMNIDGNKLTLIQNLAAKLENMDEAGVASLQTLLAANPDTWQALGQIAPSLMAAADKHKASTLVLASLTKLHPSRSHWTVGMMVDARTKAKEEAIASLPSDRRRKQALGHLNQVREVGQVLKEKLGSDTDIDSITHEKMNEVIGEYAAENEHSASTQAARMNIASQFFNHAADSGWQGNSPCLIPDAARKYPTVALTTLEAAGVLIALAYTNRQAALVWSFELMSMLRGNEARSVGQKDINLDTMILLADPKASSEYGKEGSGTVDDDQEKRPVEIIDMQFQWIRFLWSDEYANGWMLPTHVYQGAILEARKISGCARWGRKGTGRHTCRNVYRKWSIPTWKTQNQIGHSDGSRNTRLYNAKLTDKDAGAMLMLTPAMLGLIGVPYPYEAPKDDVLHVGHRLKLGNVPQHIVDEYLPKLQEVHKAIKAKLGIK